MNIATQEDFGFSTIKVSFFILHFEFTFLLKDPFPLEPIMTPCRGCEQIGYCSFSGTPWPKAVYSFWVLHTTHPTCLTSLQSGRQASLSSLHWIKVLHSAGTAQALRNVWLSPPICFLQSFWRSWTWSPQGRVTKQPSQTPKMLYGGGAVLRCLLLCHLRKQGALGTYVWPLGISNDNRVFSLAQE